MSALPTSIPTAATDSKLRRIITCRVEDLRPHPGYVRHHISVSAPQLSALARSGDLAFREALTVTCDRTILDGYARWQLARHQGRPTLPCIEYDLSEQEALQWLLQKQRRSNGLNDFTRILLALELEPWLREQARSNQQLGGKRRGSSNLTEADRLDVRSRIAAAAGVSTGSLSKARQLALAAHPLVQEALRMGEVSIHRASLWLRTPEKQLNQLMLYQNLRGITRKVDRLLDAHRSTPRGGELDLQRIAGALEAMTSEQREAVLVTEIKTPGSVLLLSSALLRALTVQGELRP